MDSPDCRIGRFGPSSSSLSRFSDFSDFLTVHTLLVGPRPRPVRRNEEERRGEERKIGEGFVFPRPRRHSSGFGELHLLLRTNDAIDWPTN
jgi:hypothetical protein